MDEQSDIAAGDRIKAKLQAAFAPNFIEVIDESHMHASHAHAMKRPGAAASPGGTHFHVKVVSDAFKGKSLVDRHRTIQIMGGPFVVARKERLKSSTRVIGQVSIGFI